MSEESIVRLEDFISDETSENFPYRFWVNNDFDVVNNRGNIERSSTTCPTIEGNQVCEQWDETGLDEHNTTPDTNNFGKIESERDLEDFSPLLVQLPLNHGKDGFLELPEGTRVSFRANNININLFRGVWDSWNRLLDQ